MQQRAISAEALERLLDFGSVKRLARDKDIVFFDKKAKKRLAKADKGLAREAERLVRTYAVLGGNGIVITVGHRYGGYAGPEPGRRPSDITATDA